MQSFHSLLQDFKTVGGGRVIMPLRARQDTDSMPPSSSAAKAKHNTKPPPRPSPSPSPPRTSKTCWKGDPFLLAEACRRAGLELSTDLSLLPGDMLSMQHHARKQQVSDLLLDFGPAQKLLEEMVELDPRPMFAKTTIYLALKLER